MSLSTRILLLFLGLSVLPVVLLGAGDYFHSVQALREVIEARSDALAEHSAREIEAAYGRLQRAGLASGEAEAVAPMAGAEERIGGTGSAGCRALATIQVRIEVPEGGGREAGVAVPVGALMAWAPSLRTQLGKAGFTQVLDRETGRLVLDSRCAEASRAIGVGSVAPAVSSAARTLDRGRPVSLRYDGESGDQFVSLSGAGPAWVVAVHTSDGELIAPFRRARLTYLGLVLVVLWAAAGAFVLLAQGAFRSLRTVTAAADQIEIGNLRPWLPPPGNDEVGRLSMAFRRMTERLEASVKQADLSQKLAAVGELATYLSHEIRNPLSSIRLSLQSLHRDLAAGFIPTDSARVIQIALGEVKRLDDVVRTVLEMGRPLGPPDGRTCQVHSTLDETLDVLRPRVRAQGIELAYAPRATRDVAQGDAPGLRSAVINLVVNAIDALEKHPDGRIRISTWSGNGEVHVRIADNGPGVPADIADSIFEPFFTTKVRGNGIGLPTALRAVHSWGGTIVHEPVAAGRGAVFVIKLKLADPAVEEAATDDTLMTVDRRP